MNGTRYNFVFTSALGAELSEGREKIRRTEGREFIFCLRGWLRAKGGGKEERLGPFSRYCYRVISERLRLNST